MKKIEELKVGMLYGVMILSTVGYVAGMAKVILAL